MCYFTAAAPTKVVAITVSALVGHGVHRLIAWLMAVCTVFVWAPSANADYMPLSGAEVAPNIAEFHISEAGIHLRLEVFVGDIRTFEDLIPDGWYQSNAKPDLSEAQRVAAFAATGLSIRRSDGRELPVSVGVFEPRLRVDRTTPMMGKRDPITGRTLPAPPADDRVFYAELFYDFEDTPPQSLIIVPPSDPKGIPKVSIGMIVFDRDVPVTRFSFLSKPATLVLDWSDPWYTRFESPNLARHHQSGLTTYLYVEPREVRHETLIRLRDLDHWVELGIEPGQILSPNVQSIVKARAVQFLSARNPIQVDGQATTATTSRAEILHIASSGLQVIEQGQDIRAEAAFVGVILTVPRTDLPDKVEVSWDMFNPRITSVPVIAYDPAGPFSSAVTPEDPVIAWVNHLRIYENPEVSAVTLDRPTPPRFWLLVLLLIGLAAGTVIFRSTLSSTKRATLLAILGGVLGVASYGFGTNAIRLPAQFTQAPTQSEALQIVQAIVANLGVASLEMVPERRAHDLSHFVQGRAIGSVAAELDRVLSNRAPGGGQARLGLPVDLALTGAPRPGNGRSFHTVAQWIAQVETGHWGHSHRQVLNFTAAMEIVQVGGHWMLEGITVISARVANT